MCQARTWHEFSSTGSPHQRYVLTHQRHAQSSFTPKKCNVHRILALRVLIERLHDFHSGLLAAYVDLRKAFDSVNRNVLWRILALCGIPQKLVKLLSSLYSDTKSAVMCECIISAYSPVNTAVRQGCVFARTLFNTCMEHVL